MERINTNNPRVRWRSGAAVGALMALLLVAMAAPVLLFGRDTLPTPPGEFTRYTTSEASDALKYHLPVIRQMAEEWPRVDVVNYRSATSPGYHLAMAAALKAGASEPALRWLNLLAGCAFVGAVCMFAGACAPGLRAALLSLPIVVSPYVLSSSCWETTDNAALAFVAIALGCAAFGDGGTRATVLGSVGAALAVSVRQLHIWPIAPLALSMRAGAALLASIPAVRRVAEPLGLAPARADRVDLARLVTGSFAILVPVAALGFFVWTWGGLMPPAYRDLHASRLSLAMPAFSLALAGIFGVALIGGAWEGVRTLRPRDPWVWLAAGVGLAAALVPPTAWNPDAGRMHGWLWEVIKRAPSVAERSLALAALAPVGALCLLAMWRTARANGRARIATVLLFGGVCWCAAQMMNGQAWHRYAEPPVLAGMIWLAAAAAGPTAGIGAWPRVVRAWTVLGPLALTGWLLLISVVTIYAKVF